MLVKVSSGYQFSVCDTATEMLALVLGDVLVEGFSLSWNNVLAKAQMGSSSSTFLMCNYCMVQLVDVHDSLAS